MVTRTATFHILNQEFTLSIERMPIENIKGVNVHTYIVADANQRLMFVLTREYFPNKTQRITANEVVGDASRLAYDIVGSLGSHDALDTAFEYAVRKTALRFQSDAQLSSFEHFEHVRNLMFRCSTIHQFEAALLSQGYVDSKTRQGIVWSNEVGAPDEAGQFLSVVHKDTLSKKAIRINPHTKEAFRFIEK